MHCVTQILGISQGGKPHTEAHAWRLVHLSENEQFRERFQLEANLTSADTFTTQYVLTNPDYTPTAQSYTAGSTTDVTLRTNVGGRRGTSGRLEILTQVGRPEITSVLVESKVNSRFTTNYT